MSTQLTLTAQAEAEAILTTEGFAHRQRDVLEQKIKVFPARAFYPSSLGHPCDRFIVWNFIRWDTKAKHDAVLESIFAEGRFHQPDIYARLEAMGFELVRESDRPVQYQVGGGGVISGRSDGRVIGFRGIRYKPALVLEAKSMSDYQWGRTDTVEDLREAESPWTRSYYAQGQLYCFNDNLPRGVFVLKNKATGLLKLIPFELDYQYAEDLLKRVERLHPMIVATVDPDPIPYTRSVCGGCGFARRCYPARSYGEGASVLDDPGLEAALARREQLKPTSDEFAKLDRELKDRFKHEGIKFTVVGDYVVEGKLVTKKTYEVPGHEEIHYTITRQGPA